MIDQELIVHQLQDALSNFYNIAVLQTSPIVRVLGLEHAEGSSTAQAVRQRLREAVESLRPSDSPSFGAPEWLDYRVLWTRYIHARSQIETCQDLAISSSTYYRRHRRALEAVASILREKYGEREDRGAVRQAGSVLASGDELLARETGRLLQASRHHPVDLARLLVEVRETILPLAKKEGVHFEICTTSHMPVVYGDPTVLSQIILGVLTEGMGLVEGTKLELCIDVQEDKTRWRVGWFERSRALALVSDSGGTLTLVLALLNAYGGQLGIACDEHRRAALEFMLPRARPRLIQIIDDDPDMTRLYRLYLQDQDWTVREAHSNHELETQLAESVPDLILLDVLMPEWDGWSILRQLKRNPTTAELPVVICSVLDQPGLALALGATKVLQKPIVKEPLVEAVREILSPRRSQG